jgi:hypothetical protein
MIKSPTFPMIFKIIIPSEKMTLVLPFDKLDHFFQMFPDRELLEYEVYPMTGFQDYHGIDIFEGDKVEFDWKGNIERGTIEYSDYNGTFGITFWNGDMFWPMTDLRMDFDDIEFTLVEE